jgi:hypothetical protein
MNAISLAVHHVRIRRVREKAFERVDCFGDTDSDLAEVLADLLTDLKKARNDKEAQHVLEVDRLDRNGREIYGIIQSGDYGIESVIRDTSTLAVVYKKRTQDVDMMPFYFHFDLPAEGYMGLLVLQRTGIFGIHGALSASLGQGFKRSFADFSLALNLVVPKELIEEFVGGESELTEIHFLKHKLSSDIADVLAKGKNGAKRAIDGSLDFAIKIRDGGFPFRDEILRIVQGGGNVGELYELIDPGFVPDNIKIRTKLAGKERMINLADPRRGLRADYDVTDQVKLRGGHPTFTSINKASTDLLKAMWKQLRGKGD